MYVYNINIYDIYIYMIYVCGLYIICTYIYIYIESKANPSLATSNDGKFVQIPEQLIKLRHPLGEGFP